MAESSRVVSHVNLMTLYNKWAYKQIEIYCNTNINSNSELYTADTGIPFNTIRNTLCHLWLSDQIWFLRMTGGTQCQLRNPSNKQLIKTIKMTDFAQFWQTNNPNEAKFDLYFENLLMTQIFELLQESANIWIDYVNKDGNNIDTFLTGEFSYKHRKGTIYKNVRSDIIGHVINHATHHRGQISSSFTILLPKIKPVCLDLIVFIRQIDSKDGNNKRTREKKQHIKNGSDSYASVIHKYCLFGLCVAITARIVISNHNKQ